MYLRGLRMCEMEFVNIGPDRFEELMRLHEAYKVEIGEDMPSQRDMENLKQALLNGNIRFFGCICDGKLVACCSVCRVFSTFNYAFAGVFEDFFIKPQWRHRGIARKLVEFAYTESGVRSMTVGCADCDEAMYRALGFDVKLGNMLVYADN